MIKLDTAYYGTPTPSYYLAADFVSGGKDREITAALYRLAADIEEATGEKGEKWAVVIDRRAAAVRLELAEGDDAEAARGMALLKAVEFA